MQGIKLEKSKLRKLLPFSKYLAIPGLVNCAVPDPPTLPMHSFVYPPAVQTAGRFYCGRWRPCLVFPVLESLFQREILFYRQNAESCFP